MNPVPNIKPSVSTLLAIAISLICWNLARGQSQCFAPTWLQLSPATSPPARHAHAMAYDSVHKQVVLFAGVDDAGTSVLGDTWVFDGYTWLQRTPAHSPSPRFWHAMTFDSARGLVVLFGGRSVGAEYDDVWEWNGTDWTEVTVVGLSPLARATHGMAYDSTRQKHVIFGGYSATYQQSLGDTWEYDGASHTWSPQSFGGPSPRIEIALAFDAARNVTLLYGGRDDSNAYLRDTWTWDGVAGVWTKKSPEITPPTLSFYSLAYDSDRAIVILHCGTYRDTRSQFTVRDSWDWDGTSWHYKTEDYGFYCCPRKQAAMVYDTDRKQMLLFGGDGADPAGTWALQQTWKPASSLYVDWRNFGFQTGSYDFPYQTVHQGVFWAGANCTTLLIQSGDYAEGNLVINKPMRLQSRNGSVYVH